MGNARGTYGGEQNVTRIMCV